MLKVRSRRRARIDVADSGALSDLAFLLIIFFIVIAVFNINSGFLLGLPRRNSVTTVQRDDLMRVRIDAEDAISVGGEDVTLAELRTRVIGQRQRQPNMTLIVVIDPSASYQRLVTMVELTRLADVDNFSFRMEASP